MVAVLVVLGCLVVFGLGAAVVTGSRRRRSGGRPGAPMRVDPSAGRDAGTAAELISRYKVGPAPYLTLVPPLAEDLRHAQRAGEPFATQVLRSYADGLAVAVRATLAPSGEPPDRTAVPKWETVAVDGALTTADHVHPAADWKYVGGRRPFNHTQLDELRTHPYIHLTAAVRALTDLTEVDPADTDRAWFLLAAWISMNLGDGQMLDPDRTLIVDLIACCSHLQTVGGGAPPAFVTDAIEHGLQIRHFDSVWVETATVVVDGSTYSEGHFEEYDSGRPLPVGALLATRFRCDAAGGPDARAELALGALLVEAHALEAARTALHRAGSDPQLATAADDLMTDLFAAEAAQELQDIFRTTAPHRGTPQRDRVVQLGRELDERGGFELMADAVRHFRRLNASEVRTLEMIWDGVGDWRG